MSQQPEHIGSYIDKAFAKNGIKRVIKRAKVVVEWPKVVGKDVAKFSRAKSFRDGVLIVEVTDNETATHLTLQRQHFLDSYREKFAVKDIKDIRFRVGVLPLPINSKPTMSQPKDPIAIDEKELLSFNQQISKLNLSNDLTKTIFGIAQILLRRKAEQQVLGWQPCEVCGILVEPKKRLEKRLCSSCQQLSDFPAVKEAITKLTVNPEAYLPFLTQDSFLVARYFAKQRLKEQMQELFPFAIANPDHLGQLRQAAYCYLAHYLEKPLEEIELTDYVYLEANIARILS